MINCKNCGKFLAPNKNCILKTISTEGYQNYNEYTEPMYIKCNMPICIKIENIKVYIEDCWIKFNDTPCINTNLEYKFLDAIKMLDSIEQELKYKQS